MSKVKNNQPPNQPTLERWPSKDTLSEIDAAFENYTRVLETPFPPFSETAPSPTKPTPAAKIKKETK